jgi:hypothetical protein
MVNRNSVNLREFSIACPEELETLRTVLRGRRGTLL